MTLAEVRVRKQSRSNPTYESYNSTSHTVESCFAQFVDRVIRTRRRSLQQTVYKWEGWCIAIVAQQQNGWTQYYTKVSLVNAIDEQIDGPILRWRFKCKQWISADSTNPFYPFIGWNEYFNKKRKIAAQVETKAT